MTTATDTARPAGMLRGFYRRVTRVLHDIMPRGLFARSLLIIIMPMVTLQTLIILVFSERHWVEVTRELGRSLIGDVAAVIDLIEAQPASGDVSSIIRLAHDRMGLDISILPNQPLPAQDAKAPIYDQLDQLMINQINRQIGRPFWVDAINRPDTIEMQIQLDGGSVLKVITPRSQAFISDSLNLILAMVATSLVLLAVAILFLRNQIQPILTLTTAVDNFGKGRPVPDFPPRGAREVRLATVAFQDMKRRVERMIEQRTAMLAGVSHDLRTVLTRMRLQLAILDETTDIEDLAGDVDAMHRMLEGYLAFARGDAGENAAVTHVGALLDEVADEARLVGGDVAATFAGEPLVRLRPQGFKRCVENLVANAVRHAAIVRVTGLHADGQLSVTVDDDGPGIPLAEREAVFRPFYRLDNARNLDESGTGLGLAIARDVARSHGGDIALTDSPLGGLRATVIVPA